MPDKEKVTFTMIELYLSLFGVGAIILATTVPMPDEFQNALLIIGILILALVGLIYVL